MLQDLLAYFAVGTVSVLAVFGFLGKSVVDLFLKRNLEVLKTELATAEANSKQRFSKHFDLKFERLIKAFDSALNAKKAITAIQSSEAQGNNFEPALKKLLLTSSDFMDTANRVRPFINVEEFQKISVWHAQFNDSLRKLSESKQKDEFSAAMQDSETKIEGFISAFSQEISNI